MTRPLLLASTSRYRRELLSRLDVEFSTAAPTFDEDAHRDRFDTSTDEAFALEMARGKADSLVAAHPDHVILAADQIAVIRPGRRVGGGPPRELLFKPGTEDAAVEQLMRLCGRTHHLTTGVVLLDARTGEHRTAVDRQVLTMRAFPRAEAEAYVRKYRPLDCVGAFRIEDAGIRLFERIDGHDFTGIIGLPLLAVARLLREHGLL